MKQTVQIRPEQARYVIAKKNAADAAVAEYMTALNASIAGLIEDKNAKVQTIADDGTVTLTVPDEGGSDGA